MALCICALYIVWKNIFFWFIVDPLLRRQNLCSFFCILLCVEQKHWIFLWSSFFHDLLLFASKPYRDVKEKKIRKYRIAFLHIITCSSTTYFVFVKHFHVYYIILCKSSSEYMCLAWILCGRHHHYSSSFFSVLAQPFSHTVKSTNLQF